MPLAGPGTDGPVVCPLPLGPFKAVLCPMTASQVSTLRAGGMYFNLHTAAFPAGGTTICFFRRMRKPTLLLAHPTLVSTARGGGVGGHPLHLCVSLVITTPFALIMMSVVWLLLCCTLEEIRGQIVFRDQLNPATTLYASLSGGALSVGGAASASTSQAFGECRVMLSLDATYGVAACSMDGESKHSGPCFFRWLSFILSLLYCLLSPVGLLILGRICFVKQGFLPRLLPTFMGLQLSTPLPACCKHSPLVRPAPSEI